MKRLGAGCLLVTIAIACASSFVSCGDDPQTEEDRVRAAVDALHEDLAEARLAEVCAAMTRRPQRQIGSVGHDREPTGCGRDLGALLQSTRAATRASDGAVSGLSRAERPEVMDVELDGAGRLATVTMALGGGEYSVPFVKQDGEWRLDDFFGADGPPPEALR